MIIYYYIVQFALTALDVLKMAQKTQCKLRNTGYFLKIKLKQILTFVELLIVFASSIILEFVSSTGQNSYSKTVFELSLFIDDDGLFATYQEKGN